MSLPQIAALATDYDGTLARNNRVDDATVTALERFRASGRALILVTGRVLPELLAVFPRVDLFHLVVAENGALLYRPETHEEIFLPRPPPPPPLPPPRLSWRQSATGVSIPSRPAA